jgi:hypothetical protein
MPVEIHVKESNFFYNRIILTGITNAIQSGAFVFILALIRIIHLAAYVYDGDGNMA